MSRRGRRVRQPRGPHKDRYAAKAAQSQAARATFDAEWERSHPASPTPAAAPEVTEDSEGEEVA